MLVSNKAKGLLFALCLAVASICQAIGFGELKVYSYLGEPLYAEIELTGYEGFDVGMLQVGLADAKAFVRAGIERPYFLTSLAFQIINYNDVLYIVVRTSKPVKSPFLEFLIELSWPGGNLIKEYTILLDPPPSDLSKESRPKSAGQLAEEQKSGGSNENGIQQQLIQQIAQQQKAQAQEALKNVVKEGDNKFSDQTFDTKEQPKVPEGQAPSGETTSQVSDYKTKRQEYMRKLAEEDASQQGGTILQSAALGLGDLKSELKPDLTVEQILADEHKEQANAAKSANAQPPASSPAAGAAQAPGTPTSETTTSSAEDVTFKNVIKPAGKQPAGAAQRLAAQTAGSTAVVTAPQKGVPVSTVPAEAPPSKGGHLYLGMILSLLLIGAGIAIALKRGLLGSTFAKRNTTSPSDADSSSLDDFDEFAQPSTPTASKVVTPPVSEDVPISDQPNDQLLDAAINEFARPEEQDVEQIELTAMPETPPEAPAVPAASTVITQNTEAQTSVPPAADLVDATLDQIEQEFENIDLDELAPPAPETEATPAKVEPTTEEPMQAAEVQAPLPQEIQSTPEEPIIPEPVPSIEPVSPPMAPPPEEPNQEPQEVPQPPTTPSPPPETAGPQLSAENTSLVAEKDEVAFKGPTLMQDQGSSLKLSEEGATLSMAREDSTSILDNSDAISKKIALAKQYIDTGDNEAAKELLQEVIETANDEQKLEAQLLLSSIS